MAGQSKPEISVIIPAYNEERRIGRTLADLVSSMGKSGASEFEIIVVSDGTDSTPEIVRSQNHGRVRLINNNVRLGKGRAISEGFLAARGSIIGFVDADGAITPQEVASMLSFLRSRPKICGVVGSRRIGRAGPRKPSPLRRVLSSCFNLLVRLLFHLRYSDTQCGAKFFWARHLKKELPFRTRGFCIDVEVLCRLSRHGRIIEYPIEWRSMAHSRFSTMFIAEMFTELISLRLSPACHGPYVQ